MIPGFQFRVWSCAAAVLVLLLPAAAARVAVEPPVVRQGSYAVLRVPGGRGPATVSVLGRALPMFPASGGLRAIVPVSVDAAAGNYTAVVAMPAGEVSGALKVVERPRGKISRLSSLTVTEDTAASLKADGGRFGEVLHRGSPVACWSGPLRHPVPGRVTAEFGVRRAYGGGAKWTHKGVDFGMPAGSPIAAPLAGVVRLSERMGAYGNVVVLDHGQTVHTAFLHMVSRAVEVGWRVEQGQVLGTVGATGLALGAHLHFGVFIAGVAVDPLEALERGFPLN